MTARRSFARVVVVTAVAVLATWQVVHRDRHGPTDVTTSSAPSVERPVMAIATPPLEAAPARPTRGPVSSVLQREALDAQDLYAFAMHARTRPAEGGWFYASAALSDCEAMALDGMLDEEVSKTITKRATVSPQQVTALDRYRRRCAGFTTGGRAEMAEWLAALKGRRDDPLMDIAMDLSAAHTSEARRPALQAMLDAHDPLLTSTMWPALSRADELAGGLASGEWFDGTRYRAGSEASRYEVAMEMAVCRPQSPCAADRGAELRCMTTGECGDPTTHLDLRVIDLSHADPDEAAMVRLARDMRAALDRADLDAFRAPGSARR